MSFLKPGHFIWFKVFLIWLKDIVEFIAAAVWSFSLISFKFMPPSSNLNTEQWLLDPFPLFWWKQAGREICSDLFFKTTTTKKKALFGQHWTLHYFPRFCPDWSLHFIKTALFKKHKIKKDLLHFLQTMSSNKHKKTTRNLMLPQYAGTWKGGYIFSSIA